MAHLTVPAYNLGLRNLAKELHGKLNLRASGFRDWGLRFKVQGLGIRLEGLDFRV